MDLEDRPKVSETDFETTFMDEAKEFTSEEESFTRKRVENSPLNSFIINRHVSGAIRNSHNSLEKPEDRRPKLEVHTRPKD